MPKKKRVRYKIVAKRKMEIIPPEKLYEEASKRGMTIKELVDYMAQRNRDHSTARNRSAFYDRKPPPLDPNIPRPGRKKKRES